jgi:hypothetical protein
MNFFINGAPKYIRCYEKKKDPPIDLFTIVFTRASAFMGKRFIGRVYYVSANGTPSNPQGGFYQHGEADKREFCPCGSRIHWMETPKELREIVLAEYCGLWGIDPIVDERGNVASAERIGLEIE